MGLLEFPPYLFPFADIFPSSLIHFPPHVQNSQQQRLVFHCYHNHAPFQGLITIVANAL